MDPNEAPFWRHHEPLPLAPAFQETTAEVVIVGAGVAGLTAAYVLAAAGLDPLVIEAERIGAAMTGRSTAHISAAVDDGWRKMLSRLGVEGASNLARAYRQGIAAISNLAATLPDAADFCWIDGELLGAPKDRDVLETEREAALRAGLDVTSVQRSGAAEDLWSIRFVRQGKLHPLKYVDGIAHLLSRQGIGLVRAKLKGFQRAARGIELRMDDDQTVTATRAVVLAHNLAFDATYPGVSISRRRSYVAAAECLDTAVADTITWDLAHPYHYSRIVDHEGRRLMLVGGADHAAEKHANPERHFAAVETWMRKRFPAVGAVEYRWHGDLKQTSDNLALLGRLPGFENVYVLDGDTGLGFNHAMIGAQIVRDQILGRENPVAAIFSPSRHAY